MKNISRGSISNSFQVNVPTTYVTFGFFYIFREYRNGALASNGLNAIGSIKQMSF